MLDVVLTPVAYKTMEAVLSASLRGSIDKGIEKLAQDPFNQSLSLCGPLAGLRVSYLDGEWCRIIYRVAGNQLQIAQINLISAIDRSDLDLDELARNLFRLRLL